MLIYIILVYLILVSSVFLLPFTILAGLLSLSPISLIGSILYIPIKFYLILNSHSLYEHLKKEQEGTNPNDAFSQIDQPNFNNEFV